MEMYPKVPEFERTQQAYLFLKNNGKKVEICFKPNYYYVKFYMKTDPPLDEPCLVGDVIYEWVGPTRTVSYQFPLDD